MNGYVLGGYVVVLGSIGGYALSLIRRLRAARRRVADAARLLSPKDSGVA